MKIFVIDGTDGSGKETQARMLVERLNNKGIKTKYITFPNYDSDYCSLVKGYLSGEFGSTANSVSPYAASLCYAMDRFAAYKTSDWEDYDVIIADRYVISNVIHQATKIDGIEERNAFVKWLYDTEYNKLGLPEPEVNFYLRVPPEISRELTKDRALKNGMKKDIHEADFEYMQKAYNRSVSLCSYLGCTFIECTADNKMLTREEINDKLFNIIEEHI